jgi:hypothetical protein
MVFCGFAAGCKNNVPARVYAPTDTTVVNSTMGFPLPVRVINREGAEIQARTALFTSSNDSLASVSQQGDISCHYDGVINVKVVAGKARADFPIRCHIARRFGEGHWVELRAGGPPVEFSVEAYDEAGQVMKNPRLPIRVDDTTIVRFENGLVYGLRPGFTSIRVMSSGREGGDAYAVRGRTATDAPLHNRR